MKLTAIETIIIHGAGTPAPRQWPVHLVHTDNSISGIGRGGFRQSRATWPGRRHLLQSWFGQASARCASEAQRKQRMMFDWRAGLAPSPPSSLPSHPPPRVAAAVLLSPLATTPSAAATPTATARPAAAMSSWCTTRCKRCIAEP